MGFWANLLGLGDGPNHEGITPNDSPNGPTNTVGGAGFRPGDPDGVVFEETPVEPRAATLPVPNASPWSGWPADWSTPAWTGGRFQRLVDTAWDCIDLNASVLSTMPAYRVQNGRPAAPTPWMSNPDPTAYQSWQEFAKQLFWDYQLGEAFVLAITRYADTGYPRTFRVIPPWMVHVEVRNGQRVYRLGGAGGSDITDDVLHIRYQSSTDPNQPRGVGPLDGAGARMITAAVLQRYVQNLSETGGVPLYWISSDQVLTQGDALEMQRDFVEARRRNLGEPAVFGKGAKIGQATSMSAKDMALLEISQWTESRIAVKLGVPPFLMGLPSGGDSMTYSNVSQLFDFHDRASLRTKAGAVMPALSNWLLPHGQALELNRDEYSRPGLLERSQAYVALHGIGAITTEEIRAMERWDGTDSATSLSGGDTNGY